MIEVKTTRFITYSGYCWPLPEAGEIAPPSGTNLDATGAAGVLVARVRESAAADFETSFGCSYGTLKSTVQAVSEVLNDAFGPARESQGVVFQADQKLAIPLDPL